MYQGFEVYSKSLVKTKVAASGTSKTSPPAIPTPSATQTMDSEKTAESTKDDKVDAKEEVEDVEDDDYDIVTKEVSFDVLDVLFCHCNNLKLQEVQHVNAEGIAEEDEEEVLNEEEVIAGLQHMFTEKHGREATPEEVKEWLSAISDLKGSDVIQDGA